MKKGILKDFLARFSPLDKFTGPYSVTLFYNRLRNGPVKNDSNNGNKHVGMQKRC